MHSELSNAGRMTVVTHRLQTTLAKQQRAYKSTMLCDLSHTSFNEELG
jgi:hypothetical protein